MRRPLRLQLLVPVLAVVILAIVGSSALSAYLAADWLKQRQQESLARVVATLTDASFPLTESVLKKMSGLSGAEFVVLDSAGGVEDSSWQFAADDVAQLRQLPREHKLVDFGAGHTLDLTAGRFLASRLSVTPRGDGSRMATLVVLYPEERWAVARRQVIYPPLVVGAAAILLAVAVTALLARRVVGPLETLRRQAAAIEEGDFRLVPLNSRNDEIQDLSRTINHMVERLAQYEADVRQNERLRTLGQLGAGIAHQVRNAATGARLALDLHRQDCPLQDSETLDVAARQFKLIETYLQRFLTLGGRKPPASDSAPHEQIDLVRLIEDVLPLIRPAFQHAGIALKFDPFADRMLISGDAQSLQQLLVNLLTNGFEAAARNSKSSTNGGAPVVEIQVARAEGGRIDCRIGDSGPGPAEEIGNRLFDPFISDKPDGTGLGLAVCHQIVVEHNAQISWCRTDGMTWFVVSFQQVANALPTTVRSVEADTAQLTTDNNR
jgi:signal transduction histidine kinase